MPAVPAFLDLGCGSGNVLELVHQQFQCSPIVGIEIVCDFCIAAQKLVPSATILHEDLSDLSQSGVPDALEHKPTIAYCYDGGLLPETALQGIYSFVPQLPRKSIVVFITSFVLGDYDAESIITGIESNSDFLFIGALHNIKEDDTRTTMNALFFSQELKYPQNGLEREPQEDDDTLSQDERRALDDVKRDLKKPKLATLHIPPRFFSTGINRS